MTRPDPAPANDPPYVVCIRTADAHRIIDESRDARCSRCDASVWLPVRVEASAPNAPLICSQCFARDALRDDLG